VPSEFELIARHFTRAPRHALLGVGDDCALIRPEEAHQQAISTDSLIEGVHFLSNTDAARLGHKALAVNLSDLAAIGARPRYALLALSLPHADDAWCAAFARGLFELADAFDVDLIGGDTTRAPVIMINLTVIGDLPPGAAIRRGGAKVGDDVYVSGTLGDAALGLAALSGQATLEPEDLAYCVGRLEAPTPRVALGLALRGTASAMLDLSDGLSGDLAHIARASGVSAEIDLSTLPLSAALEHQPLEEAHQWAISGGDDYELCFTAAPALAGAVRAAAQAAGVMVTRIGRMVNSNSVPVKFLQANGTAWTSCSSSHDHFAGRE
jgi:thiamine-monophosphate kinase